mmetsp:Transcript_16489/g.23160  ORF Transcript_16489/g.23160 Transcript_16489/m.23160 type:complete len:139 (+) Transcript_16489:61-477(+)
MFEAVTDKDGKLDEKVIVRNYWFDIDAKPAEKAIKAGNPACTSDTNFFENKMAYGISGKKGPDGKIKISIVSLAKRVFDLVEEDGDFSMQGSYDGKTMKLRKVYVNAKEGWTTPTVLYVLLFWEPLDGGEIVVEKVLP